MKTEAISMIDGFSGWSKLNPSEQATVRSEANDVMSYLKSEAHTKLAVGEGLIKIQDILLPKRIFFKFLQEIFHMSKSTAYRYIDLYKQGKELLPDPVLEQAVSRGTKLSKEIITANPPPKGNDPIEITTYLNKLESIKPTPVAVSVDNDTLMKEVVNFCNLRYQRVTGNKRAKDAWVKNTLGMIATRFGFASDVTVSPIAVPAAFESKIGRPKQEAA